MGSAKRSTYWALVTLLACAAPPRPPTGAPSNSAAPPTPTAGRATDLATESGSPEETASADQDEKPPQVEPWPEATARFQGHGAWLGADSAYSIALDATHVLWLFADTFIDPAADGSRSNGPNYLIRNSVGIQTSENPAHARDLSKCELKLFWGRVRDGAPTSFFGDIDSPEQWLWPLHGARLPDGHLLLFRMRVSKESGGLGFRVDSWDAVAIDDPSLSPDDWQPRLLTDAVRDRHLLVGSSVMVHESWLYAYAVDTQSASHTIYLARWPLAQLSGLKEHALDNPQWWTPAGFVAQADLDPKQRGASPAPLFDDGQIELSVHYDATRGRFMEIQMQGLFVADTNTQLGFRTALRPEGPWSTLTAMFRPTESSLGNASDLAAYAAKAHPEQRGADLVLTYMVNDLKRFPPADNVYYPQVLRAHCP